MRSPLSQTSRDFFLFISRADISKSFYSPLILVYPHSLGHVCGWVLSHRLFGRLSLLTVPIKGGTSTMSLHSISSYNKYELNTMHKTNIHTLSSPSVTPYFILFVQHFYHWIITAKVEFVTKQPPSLKLHECLVTNSMTT